MPKRFTVLFQPEGRRCAADEGQTVLQVAQAYGIALNAPCGGKGVCGGCRVRIPEGANQPTAQCREVLSTEELERGLRLACQGRITSDTVVVIPAESRRGEQQILEDGTGGKVELAPAIRKLHLTLTVPTVADQRADMDRLTDALRDEGVEAEPTLDVRRSLPTVLREAEFNITAVLAANRIVAIQPGDATDALLGVSVDIGTTTVVGKLLDLKTGRTLATAGKTNPQTAYGDDVVSRIEFATTRPDGPEILRKAVTECLSEIVDELLAAADVTRDCVHEMVAVGNTTMGHLLLRLPSRSLAEAPYVGAQRDSVWTDAAPIGVPLASGGRIFVAPNIAGFVGGDTVGMILATDMHKTDGIRLGVDIGTNGEMVLATPDGLTACSTAAGPAFEGARITYGMRAMDGAIDRVDISEAGLKYRTIGDQPPAGLCGSGLLDALAELLRIGLIDETGTMELTDALREAHPWLAARFGEDDHGTFVALTNIETNGGKPVLLTQRDVRQVQLAKAAIRAGIDILMKEAGVKLDQIERIYLAGAFGNYIRKQRALAVGLLPPVDEDIIEFVGNAAGAGATQMLLNADLRNQAEQISRSTRYVELAGRADFQGIFTEMLMFPTPNDK